MKTLNKIPLIIAYLGTIPLVYSTAISATYTKNILLPSLITYISVVIISCIVVDKLTYNKGISNSLKSLYNDLFINKPKNILMLAIFEIISHLSVFLMAISLTLIIMATNNTSLRITSIAILLTYFFILIDKHIKHTKIKN